MKRRYVVGMAAGLLLAWSAWLVGERYVSGQLCYTDLEYTVRQTVALSMNPNELAPTKTLPAGEVCRIGTTLVHTKLFAHRHVVCRSGTEGYVNNFEDMDLAFPDFTPAD